jgi:hypothetical protein
MQESTGNIASIWELRNEPEMANALAVSLMGERMTNVERVEIHHMLGRLYAAWSLDDTHATAFARSAMRHGHLGAILFLESVQAELGAKDAVPREAPRVGASRLASLIRDVSKSTRGAAAVEVVRRMLEDTDIEFTA